MSAMRLLEGEVEDSRDDEIRRLLNEISILQAALSEAEFATVQARSEAARALTALRRQLDPLYQALRVVFGHLDAAGVSEVTNQAQASGDPRLSAVWASWKSKLGQGAAKCIDALLLHGEMNTQQLAIATGYHRNTVPQYVSQLNKAGLIDKRDGKFRLKHL